jgi:diguanylate cyclase (GGDEF)-like protein
MAILGVTHVLLVSDPIPFPPDVDPPSVLLVLASRIVVLIGVCAIATAERRFSERQSRELEQLARYDSLTGLLNRRGFLLRLGDSLARARRHGRCVGLIFLDLDAFKQINDEHGHAVGDSLLKSIGTQIASITRASDAAGRAGGDEFVMLLEDVDESKDVELLAERILVQLQSRIGAAVDSSLALGMSIGAACFPEDGDDVESLMHAADLAMYRAKGSGGSAVRTAST